MQLGLQWFLWSLNACHICLFFLKHSILNNKDLKDMVQLLQVPCTSSSSPPGCKSKKTPKKLTDAYFFHK